MAVPVSLCLAALVLFHLPLVQHRLVTAINERLPQWTGLEIRVKSGTVNLFTGSVTVSGLTVQSLSRARNPSEFICTRLHANISVLSLMRGVIRVQQVNIESPEIRLHVDENGHLHHPFETGAPGTPKPDTPGAPLPEIRVESVGLSSGAVTITDDRTDGIQVSVMDISGTTALQLPGLISAGYLTAASVRLEKSSALANAEPWRIEWTFPGGGDGDVVIRAGLSSMTGRIDARLTDVMNHPAYTADLVLSGNLSPVSEFLGDPRVPQGDVSLNCHAEGVFDRLPVLDLTAGARDLRFRDVSGLNLNLRFKSDGYRVTRGELSGEIQTGSFRVNAEGTLEPDSPDLTVTATVSDLDLDGIPLPPDLPVTPAGRMSASADARIRGAGMDDTEGRISLSVTPRLGPAAPDVVNAAVTAEAMWKGRIVTVTTLTARDSNLGMSCSGVIDTRTVEYRGSIRVDAVEIAPYAALAGITASGEIHLAADGTGTVDSPAATGTVRLRQIQLGGLSIPRADAAVRIGDGRFRLTADPLEIMDFRAVLAAAGDLPGSPGSPPPAISGTLDSVVYDGSPLPGISFTSTLGVVREFAIRTTDSALNLHASQSAETGLTAEGQLTSFSVATLHPFLPAEYRSLSGFITGRIIADQAPSQNQPSISALITGLTLTHDTVQLTNPEPVDLSFQQGVLHIGALSVQTGPGSTLSVTGDVNLADGRVDMHVRAALPSLREWSRFTGVQDMEGTADMDMMVSGPLPMPDVTGRADLQEFSWGGVSLPELHVTARPGDRPGETACVIRTDGLSLNGVEFPGTGVDLALAGDTLSFSGTTLNGALTVTGHLETHDTSRIDANLTLTDLDLSMIHPLHTSLESITGRLTGAVQLSGPVSVPEDLIARGEVTGLQINSNGREFSAAEPVVLTLQSGLLTVLSCRLTGEDVGLIIRGRYPVLPCAGPAESSPVLLEIDGQAHVGTFLPFIPVLDRLSGRTEMVIQINGCERPPDISGRLILADVLLDGYDLPAPVENLNGTVTISPDRIATDGITARFGGGSLLVTGGAELSDLAPESVSAALQIRNVSARITPATELTADADLTVSGSVPTLSAAGVITVKNLVYTPELDFLEMLEGLTKPRVVLEKTNVEEIPGPSLGMKITVNARESIRIENDLMRMNLSANLQLMGDTDTPGIQGKITIHDGYLNMFRAEFEVTRGIIRFIDPFALDPDLDIQAVTTKSGEEITLRISGRSSQPNLQLQSSSGRSQSDIVKLLAGAPDGDATAGKTLGEIAVIYATETMATALADMLGRETDLIIIPFPSNQEGDHLLFGVGKRIGDRLVITYYRSAKTDEGDVFEIEYTLTPEIQLDTRQNQDGTVSGGIRYTYEFN